MSREIEFGSQEYTKHARKRWGHGSGLGNPKPWSLIVLAWEDQNNSGAGEIQREEPSGKLRGPLLL
jgi:hypothetical protein